MTRGVGVTTGLQELLPAWSAPLVALLTALGDVVVLVTVLCVAYLVSAEDREGVAIVGLVFVAASGLYKGLKVLFAADRPEQRLVPGDATPDLAVSVHELLVSTGSYGFPSGHATSAAVVYLGLAAVLSVGTRRQRFGLAGLVVVVVATTRLALGAHFLVDVVAGILLGVTLLAVVFHAFEWSPVDRLTTAFGVALAGSAWYVLASGVEPTAVALLGGTLVAFGGWRWIR